MPGLLFVFTGIGLLVGALVAHYWGSDSHAAATKSSVGRVISATVVNPTRPPIAQKGQPLFSLPYCEWGYCVGATHGPKGWRYEVMLPSRRVVTCSEDEVVR